MIEILSDAGKICNTDAMNSRHDSVRDELVELLHLYSLQAQQVGDAFAQKQGLHPTDLQAMIAVREAESRDNPLTPGRLAEALGLSSGATTAVIDRLERAGHLRRVRESSDRRVVHLRYGESGQALASAFFRPLSARSHEVFSRFTDAELEIAARFLRGMTEAVAAHYESVRTGDPAD